jgi:IS5 family transposase
MRQASFATGFERYSKVTKREKFLYEMDRIVPWQALGKVVASHYPTGERGRPPVGVARMLRIYLMQLWFDLSDPGMEEALYDSAAMRNFAGIDLGREAAPDETTICKFRHLLEAHDLGEAILAVINKHLEEHGITIGPGTIVDATIIHAPSSTKNAAKERDPEMHQTRKGNQWYFGMKAHVGMDSRTRVIHSVVATAANVHDSQVLGDLLHGEENKVWGDSAYQGQGDAMHEAAPDAQDMTSRRASRNHPLTEAEKKRNTTKARVRSRVEHGFHVMKRIFGFTKTRYRGLTKNANRLFATCGLVNLYFHRDQLFRQAAA